MIHRPIYELLPYLYFSIGLAAATGKILCERCEDAAVKAGLPSADELSGRPVHKGGVVAVATCCQNRARI